MKLVRWNPARDLVSFENDMNQLFNSLWANASPGANPGGFLPALDVSETQEGYRVTAELPGMSQADIKLSVIENTLVIKGEKKPESNGQDAGENGARVHRIERRYGSFERILGLATRVDKNRISATMKDGVLDIRIPKSEEAREREIQVEVK